MNRVLVFLLCAGTAVCVSGRSVPLPLNGTEPIPPIEPPPPPPPTTERCPEAAARIAKEDIPDKTPPVCDRHGNYALEQCNALLGTCHCVHPQTGLRVDGLPSWRRVDELAQLCPTFDIVTRSACEQRSAVVRAGQTGDMAAYECDPATGDFKTHQCTYSTFFSDECTHKCLDAKTGAILQEFSDEEVAKMKADGKDLDAYCKQGIPAPPKPPVEPTLRTIVAERCPEAAVRIAKENIPDKAPPTCDRHGNYALVQCNALLSTCHCVHPATGRPVDGLPSWPTVGEYAQFCPTFGIVTRSTCEEERDSVRAGQLPDAPYYECDPATGDFVTHVCTYSTFFSDACTHKCVDAKTGAILQEFSDEEVAQMKASGKDLDAYCKSPMTAPPAPIARDSATAASGGECAKLHRHPPSGVTPADLPDCDAQGNFKRKQCGGAIHTCSCVHPLTGNPLPEARFTWPKDDPASAIETCPTLAEIDAGAQ